MISPPKAAAKQESWHLSPDISARTRALGPDTLDDLKLAVLKQRPVWWQGHAYICPLCDLDFFDTRRAAEHVIVEQHPVLRMNVPVDSASPAPLGTRATLDVEGMAVSSTSAD